MIIITIIIIIMIIFSTNNSNNFIIKLFKKAKIICYYLSCHRNEWTCSKKYFYFLVKIPKLNCIFCAGPQKAYTNIK